MEARYIQVVNWINESIKNGTLNPGDKLYSENELSKKFSMSRQTIRRALDILEEDGRIRRTKGSGTYITQSRTDDIQKRKRVAVITTYVDSYIFPNTIRKMEEHLSEKGFSIQIAFTNNRISREKDILEEIIKKDEVAGIIVEATKSALPNPNIHLYEEIRERGIPIIFLNCFYPDLKVPHVSIDDVKVGELITQCLIDHGHKKIGGVFKLDDGQGSRRYRGFLTALNKNGIPITGGDIVWFDTVDLEEKSFFIEHTISRLKDCTGIVVYNDQTAALLITEMENRGIEIPNQISIVGVDDSAGLINGHIGMTTVPYPTDVITYKVVDNLLEMIRNPKFDGNCEIDVDLVIRNSIKNLMG